MPALPPQPDFDALEAAAPATADRRTLLFALIGHLVVSWSNNESLLVYVLMLLLDTDETSAAITFGTLNTTRARLDLIHRLGNTRIANANLRRDMDKLMDRFGEATRARNEFNHCLYVFNARGEIVQTHSMRVIERKGSVRFGAQKPVDDARIREILATIDMMRALNRDLWALLPVLANHLRPSPVAGSGPGTPLAETTGAG